jgi:hypothetical protein
MDRARDELLARPRLAQNEHGGVARADPRDHRAQVLDGGAHADEARSLRRPADDAAQSRDLAAEPVAVDGVGDALEQVVIVERLGHEAERAAAHRVDRGVDGAVRGEDDDGDVGGTVRDPVQDVEAGLLAEAEIEQHRVEPLARDLLERRRDGV